MPKTKNNFSLIVFAKMKRVLIQTKGKNSSRPEPLRALPKPTEEKAEETAPVDDPNAPVANISHVYNHKLLEEYEKYFNDDELLNDRNAQEEGYRKMIALYALKNYRLLVEGEELELLEIEIYSHGDCYKDFLLGAFSNYEQGWGPHPECVVFCIKANNAKVSGDFYVMVTALERNGQITEGRNEVYKAIKDFKYEVKSPGLEIAKTYDFGCNDYIYRAPRRGLNFSACQNKNDLNVASKNIMAARSYTLKAEKFCDARKIIYAYQCMRYNEGHDAVAEKLQVKAQKFSMWMRRFYKIPEVKDPLVFARHDYDWSDFKEYLKAFKYFTQLT